MSTQSPIAEQLEAALPYLERTMSAPRLAHSRNVMLAMAELAEIYRLDPAQAMTAGLLHDLAKDLDGARLAALAADAGLQLGHPCERLPVYLHAAVGAYLARTELGVADAAVLDAIATHSHYGAGPDQEPTLAWCLRCADLLAPVTPWHGMDKLRHYTHGGQLEMAALLLSGWLRDYFRRAGVPIHPSIDQQYTTRRARLGVADDFFERW